VQALSSLQLMPSSASGLEHLPVAELQVPATWQSSNAMQTTGLLPMQEPFWQVSVCVQAFPSSQRVPLDFGRLTHCRCPES
jgi:hypothetical protein